MPYPVDCESYCLVITEDLKDVCKPTLSSSATPRLLLNTVYCVGTLEETTLELLYSLISTFPSYLPFHWLSFGIIFNYSEIITHHYLTLCIFAFFHAAHFFPLKHPILLPHPTSKLDVYWKRVMKLHSIFLPQFISRIIIHLIFLNFSSLLKLLRRNTAQFVHRKEESVKNPFAGQYKEMEL